MQCPTGQTCDLDSLTCFSAPPPQLTLGSISAGFNHTCGIDTAGALWCWGRNQFGQLGVGDAEDRAIPARISMPTAWTEISAGADATCGISGTELYCWGDAAIVGVQSNIPKLVTPGPSQPAMDWKSVSVGQEGYCAVAVDGSTWCRWSGSTLTMLVDSNSPAAAVFASDQRQCIITPTHKLYCWGTNDKGQIGDGTMTMKVTPVEIPGTWSTVAATGRHTCAIDMDGHLWCWGECRGFQALGVEPPDQDTCASPAQIGLDRYAHVAQSKDATCALRSDHHIVCFGNNEAGQLGASTIDPLSVPVEVSGTHDWDTLTVGGEHACGITVDRNVWCWGYERFGNLGDDTIAFSQIPRKVDNENWATVSAGDTSTCAITTAGTLWCWGNNGAGQLGDNSTQRQPVPIQLSTDTDWFAVSAGTNHTCGLRGTGPGAGTLYCWGSNRAGQLGLGNNSDETEHAPKQVGITTTWMEIQAGTMETCGINAGGLSCWGDRGQKLAPVSFDSTAGWQSLTIHAAPWRWGDRAEAVLSAEHYDINNVFATAVTKNNYGVTGYKATTRGYDHSCMLNAGGASCWGDNTFGQLGSSGPSSATSARAVDLNATWKMIDAGGFATCGISSADELFCWGKASMIGSVTTTELNATPTNVAPGIKWSSVSVGHRHVCAVRPDHTLWCWGDNLQGELGGGFLGTNRPIRAHAGAP